MYGHIVRRNLAHTKGDGFLVMLDDDGFVEFHASQLTAVLAELVEYRIRLRGHEFHLVGQIFAALHMAQKAVVGMYYCLAAAGHVGGNQRLALAGGFQ